MAKLHELLAVSQGLKGQADAARADLLNTFEKKKHHFSETVKTFFPNGEGVTPVTEETLSLQTTVKRELKWIGEYLAKAYDAANQIAEANTQARADVVLENGEILLKSVPATSLLELEKRLNELKAFVAAIPTLDPAKGFTPDTARGADIFVAREERRARTKKEPRVITLAPPTDKHPAQVQLLTEDVVVGYVRAQEWSGLITTAEKGDMIDRVEVLSRAVSRARARANEVEIDQSVKIGQKILDFVFKG